jgi:hypothetical protein
MILGGESTVWAVMSRRRGLLVYVYRDYIDHKLYRTNSFDRSCIHRKIIEIALS